MFSQIDYATVYIFRPSSFQGSGVKPDIYINNIKIPGTIKNNDYLECKIYNSENLFINIKFSSFNLDYEGDITVGNNYYFKINANPVGVWLEKIDIPLTDEMDNKTEYTISNPIVENLIESNWNKQKLIDYWKNNPPKDMEGIYEKKGEKYEIAVINENGSYKIIYLIGGSTDWKEGNIKAILTQTAQYCIFKSEWYMSNKSKNNYIIRFDIDKKTMNTFSEKTDTIQEFFIKIYPTYNYNEKSSEEAIKELKLAKEKLELEIITQEEYNKIKNELSKYIK